MMRNQMLSHLNQLTMLTLIMEVVKLSLMKNTVTLNWMVKEVG